ncbi:MAG: dockerin type I repeat-containing protein, partial [Muribaculaceae bacterium]|nr:dockerin type I repeat-containing protein [Muribaculaceae bacterium]
TAPVVKMVLGEDEENRYSGELFYVDGFTAAPLLFDLTGSLVGSFENVDPEFYPMDVGANGVCEFSIDGRNFIVFVAAQYTGYSEKIDKTLACQVYICELGEAMSMDGMQRYWMVPDALGEMTDTGTRVESMNVEYGTDENGNEQITLFIFKCFNGMAVYRITLDDGEQPIGVPGDVNGDGNVNIADINAVIDLILSASYSKAGDVNGDGSVNIGDINALISIILK